jgi:hypothetical protein
MVQNELKVLFEEMRKASQHLVALSREKLRRDGDGFCPSEFGSTSPASVRSAIR